MRSLLTICCAAAVLLLGSTEGCAYKASNVKKPILTGSCPNCDLQSASLQGTYVEGAKLDSVVVADWADGIIYFLGLLITNQLLKPLVNTLLDDWGLLSDDDDMITCMAALSSTRWDKNPSYASAVADAKRRSFTPQKCVELLGR